MLYLHHEKLQLFSLVSDITYEELTRLLKQQASASAVPLSDITYEELTHSHYGYSSSYSHFWSDITYEELTPNGYFSSYSPNASVSRTLPMRN